ncbi:MAG: hypothetical protein A2X46_02160 [Lentisphaerae bacterium GWF2_57_35]|nr:MAG: hypothetical protein A2X46_02160 [Lentisphaerae bacterium GWF2_57_35]
MRTNSLKLTLWSVLLGTALSMSVFAAGPLAKLESAMFVEKSNGLSIYSVTVHAKIDGQPGKEAVYIQYAQLSGGAWTMLKLTMPTYPTNGGYAIYKGTLKVNGAVKFQVQFMPSDGSGITTYNDNGKPYVLSGDCSQGISGVVGGKVSMDWSEIHYQLRPLKTAIGTVNVPMYSLRGEILVQYASLLDKVSICYVKDGVFVEAPATFVDFADCSGAIAVWSFDIPVTSLYLSTGGIWHYAIYKNNSGQMFVDDNFMMTYLAKYGYPLD